MLRSNSGFLQDADPPMQMHVWDMRLRDTKHTARPHLERRPP